jgi:hypothetical protein
LVGSGRVIKFLEKVGLDRLYHSIIAGRTTRTPTISRLIRLIRSAAAIVIFKAASALICELGIAIVIALATYGLLCPCLTNWTFLYNAKIKQKAIAKIEKNFFF